MDKIGIMRWFLRQFVFLGLFCLVAFLSARNWGWVNGWIMVALVAYGFIISVILILPKHASLLVERSQVGKGSEKRDVLLAIAMAYSTFFIALAGGMQQRGVSNAFLWDWSLSLGVLLCLGSSSFTLWAMVTNVFFSGVVRIQEERGHQVVDNGPYAYVRHPGYVGAILFNLSMSLVLDSWWALIVAVLFSGLAIWRTAWEDHTLKEKLPGYRDYTERVKYRLLPGIW